MNNWKVASLPDRAPASEFQQARVSATVYLEEELGEDL